MMKRLSTVILVACGVIAGGIAPVAAQGLTEDEIARRFQGQIDGMGATRSIAAPEPVRHRGLVIAPSSSAATDIEAPLSANVEVEAIEYTPATVENQVNVQISFDLDSSFVREDQKPKLVTLCNVIKSIDIPSFRIIGHTDASGSEQYNDTLSVLRAEAVKRHLVKDCGIAPDRLIAVGVGERYPVNEGDPLADENRRVEFQAIS